MAFQTSYDLENVLYDLDTFGLTDVLLPFLLIFTIIFAVLQKANIFGDNKKRFNVIVALVVGLLVIIPHITGGYPGDYDVVEIINESLPAVALLVVGIVMMMILVGVFGGQSTWKGPVTGWVVIIAAVAVIWIFSGAIWGWYAWDRFVDFFGEDIVILVVILLVFGIVIALITSEGKENKANVFYSLGEKLGEFFGKK